MDRLPKLALADVDPKERKRLAHLTVTATQKRLAT
jgi:hypothetical protein